MTLSSPPHSQKAEIILLGTAAVSGYDLPCFLHKKPQKTFAQAPVVNIDPHRHGNLAAAQSFIVQAYQKLDVAQRDKR
ncbi:MAG TPA: hypothetical protein VH117_04490 [Edaphobacter sp.]|nr:hypothetical protein [Edaphobacter sp.]